MSSSCVQSFDFAPNLKQKGGIQLKSSARRRKKELSPWLHLDLLVSRIEERLLVRLVVSYAAFGCTCRRKVEAVDGTKKQSRTISRRVSFREETLEGSGDRTSKDA